MPRTRSTQPGPVWTRPDQRRPRLSRDSIVRTAIRIADAEGLGAVSMRRLAAELDARTMTLYSHVASKDDLLDLMFDELSLEASLGDELPAGWRAATTAIAHRMKELGLAHPWSLELFGQRTQLGPNTMRLLEERVRALDELQLPAAAAWSVVTAMNDYVSGYIVREIAQQNVVPDDKAEAKRWHAGVTSYLQGLAESGDFPQIAPLLRSGYGAMADNFDVGLDWLLDSVERRHAG